MLKLNDMLKVEGTDRYAVLVYGVVPGSKVEMPSIHDVKSWLLGEESDSLRVVLCEAHVYDESQIPEVVIRLMRSVMTCSGASICFAMTDGIYDGIDSFFDPECIQYIYAAAKGSVASLNYAYDEEVRFSDGWKNVILHLGEEVHL